MVLCITNTNSPFNDLQPKKKALKDAGIFSSRGQDLFRSWRLVRRIPVIKSGKQANKIPLYWSNADELISRERDTYIHSFGNTDNINNTELLKSAVSLSTEKTCPRSECSVLVMIRIPRQSYFSVYNDSTRSLEACIYFVYQRHQCDGSVTNSTVASLALSGRIFRASLSNKCVIPRFKAKKSKFIFFKFRLTLNYGVFVEIKKQPYKVMATYRIRIGAQSWLGRRPTSPPS